MYSGLARLKNYRTIAALGAAIVLSLACVRAEILEVPTEYATVTHAFAASQDGDTVLLHRGLYLAPISAPLWNITIAGEYLFTQDTLDIGACVIAPDTNNPAVRCVIASGSSGTKVRLIGLKLQGGQALDGYGGGILAVGRVLELQHCRITKCVARKGGAISLLGGRAELQSCRLDHNRSTLRSGNIMHLQNAEAELRGVQVGYSIGPNAQGSDREIILDHSSIDFTRCLITDIGWLNMYGSSLFETLRNSVAYRVKLIDCQIVNCRINRSFQVADNSGVRFYQVDSCLVELNQIAQGFHEDSNGDSTYESRFVGNVFRENIRPPQWGGMGLIVLMRADRPTILQGNLFLNNSYREWACSRFAERAHVERDFSRNYYFGNRVQGFAVPPGGANHFSGLAEGLFHHNIMDGNFGLAAFQPIFIQPPSHCEQNYWGSPLGPYDSLRNPDSDGDSVNSMILFDPYEPDTSFLSVRDGNHFIGEGPHDFLIGFAYPNPFNNEITIEFVTTKREQIRLEIFDLTGRLVETIGNEELEIGIHRRNWSAKNQASGIYFARLSSTASEQRPWLHKLVLLK